MIRNDPLAKSVMFITKCHQTPYYSMIHKNIPMRFPDCSPKGRIDGTEEGNILRFETERIYQYLLKDFGG
jgi:hypothetical protein